ncbi:hypothetical protein RFA60_000181 [Vibrio parahaemolyticus]|nr:hypothetical protein [Vibrio parahaemolyticus]
MSNVAIELPKLTETEEMHVALSVMKSKRSVRKFVQEHGLDVLESVKNVVDFVITESLEKKEREEAMMKAKEETLLEMSSKMKEYFREKLAEKGIEATEEELDEMLKVQEDLAIMSPKKPASKKSGRSPRKQYKFLIGDQVVVRAFGKPSEEIKKAMEEKGFEEQYMLLAPESVSEWLKDIEGQPQYKSKIDDIKAFFESNSVNDIDPKIEVVLSLDVETAREKFNVEMTEDFLFEGAIENLTADQEKLLIAISGDNTVEGGIDAIESLES